MKPIHSSDQITTKEAARIIGCTQAGVRHLIRAGFLNGYLFNARTVIVSRQSANIYAARPKIMGRPRVSAKQS